MPLEPFARVERPFDPIGQLVGRDEVQIVRGQRRQQSHADVGRRGASRETGARHFLEVVWRKPVIVGSDEGLEVAATSCGPGAAERLDRSARNPPAGAAVAD